MNTVILRWNPGFSSYTMLHYLSDLYNMAEYGEFEYNWSVWEHEKIHEGDRFYMVKLGYGATGIVACGTITSEPYGGEDWSGKGRQTFYVDFQPDVLINPDALPILDMKTLQEAVPDFEWDKGHSGLVLTPEQAQKLDAAWTRFIKDNSELMVERANCRNSENDRVFLGYDE